LFKFLWVVIKKDTLKSKLHITCRDFTMSVKIEAFIEGCKNRAQVLHLFIMLYP
jgi:hypothetical protein